MKIKGLWQVELKKWSVKRHGPRVNFRVAIFKLEKFMGMSNIHYFSKRKLYASL